MKATGIVRRIDNLGRIVIPNGIRKALRIKEGDPFELFTNERSITFKRYQPYGDAEWTKAKNILAAVLDRFAILDRYGDFVVGLQLRNFNKEAFEARNDVAVLEVRVCGETIAFIVVPHNSNPEKTQMATRILQQFLNEEG